MIKLKRVEDEIARELNEIIARDLKDPRLTGLISVTSVKTSKNLDSAKVYVSVMNADAALTVKVLNAASGLIRSMLFNRMRIRTVPNLNFISDGSVAEGFRIEHILKTLKKGENPADEK